VHFVTITIITVESGVAIIIIIIIIIINANVPALSALSCASSRLAALQL